MKRYLSIAALLLITTSSFSYAAGNSQQGISFAEMDVNHDSLLTQDEFHQQAQKNFDQIDRNDDGNITLNEYADMQKHNDVMDGSQFSLSDSGLFFD